MELHHLSKVAAIDLEDSAPIRPWGYPNIWYQPTRGHPKLIDRISCKC